jgi:hypothetical protein
MNDLQKVRETQDAFRDELIALINKYGDTLNVYELTGVFCHTVFTTLDNFENAFEKIEEIESPAIVYTQQPE